MTNGEVKNEYRAINCYEGLFPRNEDGKCKEKFYKTL